MRIDLSLVQNKLLKDTLHRAQRVGRQLPALLMPRALQLCQAWLRQLFHHEPVLVGPWSRESPQCVVQSPMSLWEETLFPPAPLTHPSGFALSVCI